MNITEAFDTLEREIMSVNTDKKIIKQKQNKTISVSKAQDLNFQKKSKDSVKIIFFYY